MKITPITGRETSNFVARMFGKDGQRPAYGDESYNSASQYACDGDGNFIQDQNENFYILSHDG